jgi:hypothetical protein
MPGWRSIRFTANRAQHSITTRGIAGRDADLEVRRPATARHHCATCFSG